jgi:hypothetical protein
MNSYRFLTANVWFWPLTDISMRSADVRFRGNSGHRANLRECPLLTLSGHKGYSIIVGWRRASFDNFVGG